MGNNLTANVISIDTAGSALITGTTYWLKIRWVGATTTGHTATITDGANNTVWTSVASGSNYVEESTWLGPCPLKVVTQLNVTTLQSGILYLYQF